MVVRRRFSISELVARTGVPAATIHHYLRLRLMPRPHRASSNRFLYDDRHVEGLRTIRTLRERRLPLGVIRSVLPDLLAARDQEAFRPEMWDRIIGARLGRSSRRTPSARLLAAAVEAFSRRGYADVNVDDLCRTAGVAKGSFYRHYRSKEVLFFAATESAAAEVADSFARAVAAGPLPLDRIAETLAHSLEPRLPLFMELFTRSIQRRPGYGQVAARIFSELTIRVGRQLSPKDPLSAGARALAAASATVFRRALVPSPLASVSSIRAVKA